jgi:hypothetical protein
VSSTVGAATSAAAGNLPKYAQCGGEGWAGTGTCISGKSRFWWQHSYFLIISRVLQHSVLYNKFAGLFIGGYLSTLERHSYLLAQFLKVNR